MLIELLAREQQREDIDFVLQKHKYLESLSENDIYTHY